MRVVPFWIRRKLEKKQLDVQSLRSLTLADLRALGLGSRALLWLLEYWGRTDDLEAERRRVAGVKEDEVIPGVSKIKVKQYRSLVGVWRHFGANSKEEFEALGVTDEEVARYILGTVAEEVGTEYVDGRTRNSQRQRSGMALEVLTSDWERRVEELSRYYDAPTPNDRAGLRRLAYMELRVDRIQRRLIELEASGTKASDVIAHGQLVKALSEEQVKVSAEIRALEKQLGIDRATREGEGRGDPLAVIRDGIRDSKWLLDNEIQSVVHHCPDGKVILISLKWDFFPTHPHKPYEQQCPNCGQIFLVECKKRGEAVRAADFEIPELADNYRHARTTT